jgi:hypothetical protein
MCHQCDDYADRAEAARDEEPDEGEPFDVPEQLDDDADADSIADALVERALEDDLHDAINPPSPNLNVGLARIGAKSQVARIMDVLRQRGLFDG